MVFRVTSQAQQQSILNNVFRLSEDLFNVQNAIASGKGIARPSDDPSGTREMLFLRTSIRQTEQFIRNIENIKNFARNSESALNDIAGALTRGKELAVSQISGTATGETRKFTAFEIDNLILQVLQAGNKKVGNRFVFGGSKVTAAPFQKDSQGRVVYLGNTEAIRMEIGRNVNLQINLPGSETLATDLNPAISGNTLLSDLNRGQGIPAGTFTITDREGNSGTVNVTSGMTIGSLISAIGSAGTNITASINSAQNGIRLADSSTIVTQALTVAETGGGSTAAKLGILGQRNGDMEGLDLDPRLNSSTQLSQLNGGKGLSLTSINIVNGSASGAVSLTVASTVGDVLSLINTSGFNVTAEINSQGNALRIVSNDSSTVVVVREVGTGTSAESLGLGGGRNILSTLIHLKEAMQKNDIPALVALLGSLDSGLESLGGARAKFGSISRRLDNNDFSLDNEMVERTKRLTDVEGIDLAQKASELAALELAFQATLNATARIIRPSLLDFLI